MEMGVSTSEECGVWRESFALRMDRMLERGVDGGCSFVTPFCFWRVLTTVTGVVIVMDRPWTGFAPLVHRGPGRIFDVPSRRLLRSLLARSLASLVLCVGFMMWFGPGFK